MRRAEKATSAERERDPSPLGDALRQLVVDRGWDAQLALGRLKMNWARVVGDQIASRSEPTRLENGRLTIRVEGGAWAAELALIGQSLAAAAARFLGPEIVREVAVVAGTVRTA